jgi:hypothetical protein
MFYCAHCQTIISTVLNYQFWFSDEHGDIHIICDSCVDQITLTLKVRIELDKLELDKLELLKDKIKYNRTVKSRNRQNSVTTC